MEYSRDQIEYIQRNKPEYAFKLIPSLDSVIVEFLKKYEVFVQPPKNRNVAEGALTGAITGMAGADVGGDMAMIQGQNKQTKIQEWTSWKQWALDHKDFEDFRAERIDEPKAHNVQVLEKLKDPKVQKELEPLMEKFVKREAIYFNQLLIFLAVTLGIFIGFKLIGGIENHLENKRSNEYIEWYKNQNQ